MHTLLNGRSQITGRKHGPQTLNYNTSLERETLMRKALNNTNLMALQPDLEVSQWLKLILIILRNAVSTSVISNWDMMMGKRNLGSN